MMVLVSFVFHFPRNCSFEIRDGDVHLEGRVIKFLTAFLGFKIYYTCFGGLQIS